MWEKELYVAIKASIIAGKAIMEVYNSGDMQIEYKEDKSPLTLADQKSNEVITKALMSEFDTYALLSEEGQKDLSRLDNDLCFIVDPLDGTKEFIKRNGQFTVNIALSHKGISEMGVIYVPVTKELYYAAKGLGSYKISADSEAYNTWDMETDKVSDTDAIKYIGELINVSERLHVSDNTDIPELRVVMSSSHGCAEMDELIAKYGLQKFVAMGSSLKGCLVAEGNADIYYRYNPTMEWDTAAMQCITEEAGAIFRQMDDSAMTYNREDSLNSKGFYIINNEKNRLR